MRSLTPVTPDSQYTAVLQAQAKLDAEAAKLLDVTSNQQIKDQEAIAALSQEIARKQGTIDANAKRANEVQALRARIYPTNTGE